LIFRTLSIVLLFILKQRVEDWILSPSSGESLLSWAQSTELVPTSGKRDGRGKERKGERKKERREVMEKERTHKMSLSLMLRLTVSRPVCLGAKHPFGAYDQIFITCVTVSKKSKAIPVTGREGP
jgi:hypothetical protein